jgi:hypothetical protein
MHRKEDNGGEGTSLIVQEAGWGAPEDAVAVN